MYCTAHNEIDKIIDMKNQYHGSNNDKTV